jgi:hypothetical protein
MSILVIEVVSEGLIFAADRNITMQHASGSVSRGTPQPKVLRWPKDDVLFGFVGAATLNGKPIHEWLEDVRSEFASIATLKELSEKLSVRIQNQRAQDEGSSAAQPMIVHIGGFEVRDGSNTPSIWYIRNVYKLGQFGYLDFRKDYQVTEEFWRYFPNIDASEIRDHLKVIAKQFQPFWFHQGIDLLTFNVLQEAIKSAFRLLCQQHPRHDIPVTLQEWSQHARLQVLMYGAYYEAFHAPPQQAVGGGADVVTLSWP